MIKLLSVLGSALLILGGLIVLPMPIPFGALMIASGIVLLISASAAVALKVRSFRRRHRAANDAIQSVENKLPERWKKILQRTDP